MKYYYNCQAGQNLEAGAPGNQPLPIRVATVEGQIGAVEERVTTVGGQVGNLDGWIGASKLSPQDLRALVTVLEGAPSVEGCVGELKGNFRPVAALQGQVEFVEKGVVPVRLLRVSVGPVLTWKQQEEIRGATLGNLEKSNNRLTSEMVYDPKVVEEL